MTTTTLSDSIAEIIHNISIHRVELKEEFIKAWLAVNMPKDVSVDWVINNVELCEQWGDDMKSVKWWLRFKNETSTARNSRSILERNKTHLL